jgi:hypothetical protein
VTEVSLNKEIGVSKYFKATLAAAVVITSCSGPAFAKDRRRPHHHDNNNNAAAAAVIAGVIGLGIGASIAKHRRDREDDRWDQEQYGQPFSPAARVTCYPRQRLCYKNDHIAPKWTRRMFGDY